MKLHRIIAFAVALYFAPAIAFCQDTTLSFSGTIGASAGTLRDSGGFNDAPSALSDLEGQAFSFNFSYDPALADLNVRSGVGNFVGLSTADVMFGANTLGLVSTGGANGQIEVNNDGEGRPLGSIADRYFVTLTPSNTVLTDPAGVFDDFDTVQFQLILEDSSGNLFDSDSLVNDAFLLQDLSNFNIALANFEFQNAAGTEGGTLLVDLQDTSGGLLSTSRRAFALNTFFPGSIVAVPEPSTGVAFFAVVGLMAVRRRRRAFAV